MRGVINLLKLIFPLHIYDFLFLFILIPYQFRQSRNFVHTRTLGYLSKNLSTLSKSRTLSYKGESQSLKQSRHINFDSLEISYTLVHWDI